MRVLFVTNGHGEVAVARCIAAEARGLAAIETDHFALVGRGFGDDRFADVGPQRTMPSGGLVAMGNVGAFARDVAVGFVPLWFAQRRFLRTAGRGYAVVASVGDVYGYVMASCARRPTVYVGTAKSMYVARYGAFEQRLLRGAAAVFVRDAATADALRAGGVAAEAPGNVIVDLVRSEARFPWRGANRIPILPGSREEAYAAAIRLAGVVVGASSNESPLEAALSLAPGIEPQRMAERLREAGYDVAAGDRPEIPFVASREGVTISAWTGALGAIFADATLAIGQAGTANEAAAAYGLPVVALAETRGEDWYRMRQRRLLGDALRVLPFAEGEATAALRDLLRDAGARAAMGSAGRERMGPPGGAAAIARAIVALASAEKPR